MELKGKKALVLGLGDTGLSAVRWLARRGAVVSVADTRSTPPNADVLARELPHVPLRTGIFTDDSFRGAELIVSSPGVPVADPAVARAASRIPLVGDVELFAQALAPLRAQLHGPKILAITGSNGKSTVTAMTEALCQAAGLHAVAAGNIGLPVLDALEQADSAGSHPDVYVLELSSFQLETTRSLDADAATVLNVTEDHLDRYAGMDEYAAAKARIFQGGGLQILNRQDPRTLSMALPRRRVTTFGLDSPPDGESWGLQNEGDAAWLSLGSDRLFKVSDLPLTGLHNAANALAALALGYGAGVPLAGLIKGLRSFKGLPHRVEKVLELGGVSYYDDSKGTNVGATVAALTGMDRPVVLIAGGDGKGQDFSPLKAAVAARARAVVLIGRDGPQIGAALRGSNVPLLSAATMEEAVLRAAGVAQPGDAVLLSPACASFDMFRNYLHRAESFIAAVQGLAVVQGEHS